MTTKLLYVGETNTLGFGDYTLEKKTKVEDFEFQGDLYKVKTYAEITKLEKNGMFSYESVPGTVVYDYLMSDVGVSFKVSGIKNTQITVELEPKQEYKVFVNGSEIGEMSTNLSGKLSLSVDVSAGHISEIMIKKL